jgi:glycosyltransferase involved in cell wall biosynthesis
LAQTFKKKFELNNKNIKFIVIGTPPNSKYGQEVEQILKESENDILIFPTQTYAGLAKFYQMADIAVFPKQCSMSYYEVQSTSLPVVLEENEINIDRASNKKGIIFEPGSIEDFRKAILTFGNMDNDEFETYKTNARLNILENYDYVPIAQKFTDVMINEYNRFHDKNTK